MSLTERSGSGACVLGEQAASASATLIKEKMKGCIG
jgi:hypothetical protein